MYILAIESSTTSAKAALYDTVSGECKEYARAYQTNGAAAGILDCEEVFNETIKVGRELAKGKEISCISLGGVWHSVVLCDKDMKPTTPAYNWTYTGAAELCKRLRSDNAYSNMFYQKTGCMVNVTYAYFTLLLLKEQGYDLSKYRIMGQGTYNNYRLTGQWVVTDIIASGSGLLNIRKKAFDEDLLAELGIGEENLGRLITYKDALTLSDEAARLLGVKPGIPVIPSLADGSLNHIGSGAMKKGVMTFSVGTSGALRMVSEKPVLPDSPSTWCYLGPDTWLSGAATSGCCSCVDWFRSSICDNSIGYAELDKRASEVLEDTPVFLPFLFGERCPGWNDERRSSFLNVKPAHTKYAMYRAVLEGTLFNLYQCYEILCRLNGAPDKIRLSGGIVKSDFWMQMCADIFGKEMEIDTLSSASLLGGIVLAQVHLGLIDCLSQKDSPVGAIVSPNTEMSEVYRKKYELYLKYYKI